MPSNLPRGAVCHRPLFGYVSGAAETGAARQGNRDALDAWRLVPNVLRGVDGRSTACILLDESYTAPFDVAPMGLSALMASDGDVASHALRRQRACPSCSPGRP